MQALKSLSIPPPYHFHGEFESNSIKRFLVFFCCSFSSSTETKIQVPKRDSPFTNCLINTFKFSKAQALSISTRFSGFKSPAKPQSAFLFLKNLGFSETHIRSAVRVSPQILFADIDKTLRPKIEFFQELGLVGSELAKFISKNSTVLNASLQRRLIPGVAILKKILSDDENNQNLFRVLRRCNSVVTGVPESRLVGNIAYLKSCGIVGSQLSMLLTRQPWLFVVKESKLRGLVSRVLEMGFAVNTRMLVYALYTVSCMSNETFMRKLELFQSYGFTSDECIAMFRKAPALLGGSEEKLKLGIEFFINTMKWEKSVLIRAPSCLMYSMEARVFPRFRVLQIIKSKGLLKREPRFINSLNLSEEEFLARFIAKFIDHAEELLVAYKGHLLDSCSEDES